MPANLKILYDNAADRATSLSASTTSGALVAANMQTDRKTQCHRSTGTSVSYTATWTNAVNAGAVALPASNLSSTATIRARLFSDTACTVQLADSGTITACPGLNLSLWDWTGALNVNAFPYGGASKSAVWFSQNYSTVRGCIIDLVDSSNAAGYIDCSRLVIGPWWAPTYNPGYGAAMSIEDMSKSERVESGDFATDRAPRFEKLSFDLQLMPEADRSQMNLIIRNAGTGRNLFFSLLPGLGTTAEQDHMIYGKRSSGSGPISFDGYSIFGNKVEVEGW